MNAAKVARDHGWKTDTQITEDLGGDFEENLETIKRENERRVVNNVPAPPLAGQQGPVPEPQGKDENDEKAQQDEDEG